MNTTLYRLSSSLARSGFESPLLALSSRDTVHISNFVMSMSFSRFLVSNQAKSFEISNSHFEKYLSQVITHQDTDQMVQKTFTNRVLVDNLAQFRVLSCLFKDISIDNLDGSISIITSQSIKLFGCTFFNCTSGRDCAGVYASSLNSHISNCCFENVAGYHYRFEMYSAGNCIQVLPGNFSHVENVHCNKINHKTSVNYHSPVYLSTNTVSMTKSNVSDARADHLYTYCCGLSTQYVKRHILSFLTFQNNRGGSSLVIVNAQNSLDEISNLLFYQCTSNSQIFASVVDKLSIQNSIFYSSTGYVYYGNTGLGDVTLTRCTFNMYALSNLATNPGMVVNVEPNPVIAEIETPILHYFPSDKCVDDPWRSLPFSQPLTLRLTHLELTYLIFSLTSL